MKLVLELSPLAERVLENAQTGARKHNGRVVEPIDLFRALLSLNEGAAYTILDPIDNLASIVEYSLRVGRVEVGTTPFIGNLPYSSALTRVFENVSVMQKRLQWKTITTLHLLLGLLEESQEVIDRLLTETKVDKGRWKQILMEKAASTSDTEGENAESSETAISPAPSAQNIPLSSEQLEKVKELLAVDASTCSREVQTKLNALKIAVLGELPRLTREMAQQIHRILEDVIATSQLNESQLRMIHQWLLTNWYQISNVTMNTYFQRKMQSCESYLFQQNYGVLLQLTRGKPVYVSTPVDFLAKLREATDVSVS